MIKLPSLSLKQKIVTLSAGVLIVGSGAGLALSQPQTSGADTSPLTTEVDRQGEQLNNHEARITNTENDVKDLQNNTSTPPSTNRVSVPPVSSTTQIVQSTPNPPPSPSPTPTPTPAPTPEPTPQPINPRTITAMSDEPGTTLHTCHYTLYDATENAKQGVVILSNGVPCHSVGEVLPY